MGSGARPGSYSAAGGASRQPGCGSLTAAVRGDVESEELRGLVRRLEVASAASPVAYRIRVAALALVGLVGLAGVLAAGMLVVLALGALLVALLLLAAIGEPVSLFILLLGLVLYRQWIPVWTTVRSAVAALGARGAATGGRELCREEAPALFTALDHLRARLGGPPVDRVLVVDGVGASVVRAPGRRAFGGSEIHLLLGLPLLESLPVDEALAVVAHEYGHVAGAHLRFSGMVYRLRGTWQAVAERVEGMHGWLGSFLRKLARGYVPRFDAYSFVLARADEYAADAASARLVGGDAAARALKRVAEAARRHDGFLGETFRRASDDPAPPADRLVRWASVANTSPPHEDARRWLAAALDQEGHVADTHPTLRARLAALPGRSEPVDAPPPPRTGASAAEVWLGPHLATVRAELQAAWADAVALAWVQRHAAVRADRERLGALDRVEARTDDEEIERIRLSLRVQPDRDVLPDLVAFNAAHPDHPETLFLEGSVRLERGDRVGLDRMARLVEVEPEATVPACTLAVAFCLAHDPEAASEWHARRQTRVAYEQRRAWLARAYNPHYRLLPHALPEATVDAVRDLLTGPLMSDIAEVYLARRELPIDPPAYVLLLVVKVQRWAAAGGKRGRIQEDLVARPWPVPLHVLVLGTADTPFARTLAQVADARVR